MIQPPPPETLIPKQNESWTLITRRNRRNRRNPIPNPPPPSQTLTLTLTPSPFTPTGFSDPHRESKLLTQIQSAINQLSNSQFLRRFLSRLHHPQIQHHLNKLLTSSPHIQIVAYGIGSIESYKIPRLQLALALLLKRELGAKSPNPIDVFDPVLSVVECNVLAALGFRVIDVDECGRREAAGPTVFYMPHCEAALYDNLLGANWKAVMLRRMVVVGNSFGVYERNVREMRGACGCVDLERDGRHLIGARRFVREVEMEERGDEEEDVEFYMAFHDMSWHFFEIDDDADLRVL